MKNILYIIFVFLFSQNSVFSQGTAGDKAKFEYRTLIDMPTAGTT